MQPDGLLHPKNVNFSRKLPQKWLAGKKTTPEWCPPKRAMNSPNMLIVVMLVISNDVGSGMCTTPTPEIRLQK